MAPKDTKDMPYIHSRLQTSEIRLFRGHVDLDGTLRGELRSFGLKSSSLPAFHAVSYTWGVPEYSETIDIQGLQLPVLESLAPLLRYLLQRDVGNSEGWWWIDSLCINQTDRDEKGSQVSLMGTIFSIAQRTVVWLGEEADDSARAFEFLHMMDRAHATNKTSRKEWLAEVEPRRGPFSKEWESLERLFARPWWTRAWTVQEYILPRKLRMYCGDATITDGSFNQALQGIWCCRGKTLLWDNPWNRARLLQWNRRFGEDQDTKALSPSLVATLGYLGFHQATDPRDRIYSLAGLVKDFDLVGAPDYELTAEQLYLNLVKSFVNKYQSLDIICFATMFGSSNGNAGLRLPSWAPDWTIRATALVAPMMVSQSIRPWIGNFRPVRHLDCTATYNASLNLKPNIVVSDDFRELTCQGFILDSIDGLSGLPPQQRMVYPHPGDNLVHAVSLSCIARTKSLGTKREIDKVVTSLMRCLTLDRGDNYFNHHISTYDYACELRLLLSKAIARDSSLPSLFRAWLDTNGKFDVGTWNLNAILTTWSKQGGPQHESSSTYYESFYARFENTILKMRRRLVVTSKGILATAPRLSEQGDLICILYGCSVPVALRACHGGRGYTFIGECYVDGYMNGEAFSEKADLNKTTFRLI